LGRPGGVAAPPLGNEDKIVTEPKLTPREAAEMLRLLQQAHTTEPVVLAALDLASKYLLLAGHRTATRLFMAPPVLPGARVHVFCRNHDAPFQPVWLDLPDRDRWEIHRVFASNRICSLPLLFTGPLDVGTMQRGHDIVLDLTNRGVEPAEFRGVLVGWELRLPHSVLRRRSTLFTRQENTPAEIEDEDVAK
jgi:hypothetical protein